MKQKNSELSNSGGIKTKYNELISCFDNFDTTSPPRILNNDVNFYQMGWSGPTTIASMSIFEIADNVNLKFELMYNKAALKRSGVDVNSLPPFNKAKE